MNMDHLQRMMFLERLLMNMVPLLITQEMDSPSGMLKRNQQLEKEMKEREFVREILCQHV